MDLIQFDRRLAKQPQGAVSASEEARRDFSNLWVINSNGFTPDLIGECDLVRVSDPSSYGPGVSSGGTGLLGVSTATNSTPKGLNSDGWIGISDEASLFVIATLNSRAADSETTLFRSGNPGYGGVAINLFPQSGRVRALLAGVSWQTGNDRTDSNLTVGVPWFFGLSYTRAHGFWCYSSPVGRLGQRLGTQIVGWGSTVTIGGPAYIGGMSDGGAPFPGVIHAAGYSAKSVLRERFERIGSQPYKYLLAPRRIWVPVSAGGGGATATLAATGNAGAFAGSAQSSAVASLAATGNAGTFAATAQSVSSAALATTGDAGTFAATAQTNATATLASTGVSGVFSGSASSPAVASLAAVGEIGTFAGSAGAGTSVSLAVTGDIGTFSGTATAPASVALAALGGEGAFAGSAWPLTSAQLAALGDIGTFSGLASTVGTASLAATGDRGTFAGSAASITSAALAALGDGGVFSGAAAGSGAPASLSEYRRFPSPFATLRQAGSAIDLE